MNLLNLKRPQKEGVSDNLGKRNRDFPKRSGTLRLTNILRLLGYSLSIKKIEEPDILVEDRVCRGFSVRPCLPHISQV